MLINLDLVLHDLRGRPFNWNGTSDHSMTLGDTLFAGLTEAPDQSGLTPKDKRARYRIAQLLSGKGGIEIDEADLKVARDACERFPILLLGALDDALGGPPG